MKINHFASMLVAVCVLLLAVSIFYFAHVIKSASLQVPNALSALNNATEQVEYALIESRELRQLLPIIQAELDKVHAQVPLVLEEVSQVREQVPIIIDETSKIRALVPVALKDTATMSQQLEAIAGEVAMVRQHVPSVLEESAEVRALLNAAVSEVAITRESVPQLLNQIEKIVADTNQIGKSTSEGAIAGIATGVLKTPFRVLSGFAKAVFGGGELNPQDVADSDVEIIKLATYRLLGTANRGESVNWTNPLTEHQGSITFKSTIFRHKRPCKILHYTVTQQNSTDFDRDVTFCLDDEQKWQPTRH